MYGYRYKPGGHVFALQGYTQDEAAAVVIRRRRDQGQRGNASTAELVERAGDGWLVVSLPGDESEAVQ